MNKLNTTKQVDLRTIPYNDWDSWLGHPVTLSEAVVRHIEIASPGGGELGRESTQLLEGSLRMHHKLKAPYFITRYPENVFIFCKDGPDTMELLTSNRSAASLLHDFPTLPPVDLRPVAPDRLDEWIDFSVVLPESIARYIDGSGGAKKLNKEESDSIELALEKYHGISSPYCICLACCGEFTLGILDEEYR